MRTTCRYTHDACKKYIIIIIYSQATQSSAFAGHNGGAPPMTNNILQRTNENNNIVITLFQHCYNTMRTSRLFIYVFYAPLPTPYPPTRSRRIYNPACARSAFLARSQRDFGESLYIIWRLQHIHIHHGWYKTYIILLLLCTFAAARFQPHYTHPPADPPPPYGHHILIEFYIRIEYI